MAESSVAPEDNKKKKSAAEPHEAQVEISALGLERGLENNLPFSAPYRPVENGTKKNSSEKLLEVHSEEGDYLGPTIRQLVTMRRMDGQARALYRLLTLPIRSALNTATFLPAEDGEEEAAFIEAVFHTPPESGGMTVTFHRFMAQMLSGLFDGFSAFEKVFWQPSHGPLKGKYTLKKLGYRPPETITFITDETGGFAGLRQRANISGKAVDVFIPKEYAFYFAAQEEERKFYGISFFQSAFYHYDKKAKMYFIAHLAAQRAAVGTRAGTVPPNATVAAKTEFASQLNNLAVAQWMMMPEGFKVEILKETGSFQFLDWVNHHNSQMSKSILAAFFDKDQGAGKADSSLVQFAGPGDDMFLLMLRAVMDDIANQINHYIIPQLIDYNFDGGKYPKFTWGKLTEEQKSAVAATFDKLMVAGQSVTVTPEFVRALEELMAEEFGLEIDYDEVDAREAEEAAATNAQQGFDENGHPLPLDPITGLPIHPGQEDEDGEEVPADGAAPAASAVVAPGQPAPAVAPKATAPAPAVAPKATAPAAGATPPPAAPAPQAAPATPTPAPAAPAAPTEATEATPVEEEDPEATALDFLEQLEAAAKVGMAPADEEQDEDEKDFEESLKLSGSDTGLIELAQGLLNEARRELNG